LLVIVTHLGVGGQGWPQPNLTQNFAAITTSF
jgi:hypothetical protein